MKVKQLEGYLGNLEQFRNPKVELEQYPTGPHIFAENSLGDIGGKVVADFGCGHGALGVAAALLDAEYIVRIDIDCQSLEIVSINAEDLELDLNLIQCDISNSACRERFVTPLQEVWELHIISWGSRHVVDTIVMNPPFGTQKKGTDMDFLFMALKHVKRTGLQDFNAKSAEVLCELWFDVPKLYGFHKEEVDIAVDLCRFVP